MKKKITLYEIQWIDATTPEGAWRTWKEAIKWARESNHVITECGWLLEKTETHWLLATRICSDDKYAYSVFGGLFKLPHPWIVSKRRLGTITVDVNEEDT